MRSIFRTATVALSIAALGTLAACSSNPPAPTYYPTSSYPSNQYPVNAEFGRLSNVEALQSSAPRGTSGGGALLGAVIGGVLGNQVGGGTGRAVATAAGAIGGAVVGNNIEGRRQGGEVGGYRLSIQMDAGGYRVYDVPTPGDLRIGDRVRVDGQGQISRV